MIVQNDFPSQWPTLFDQCMAFIGQSAMPPLEGGYIDEKSIVTGLLCLKAICRKYEYEQDDHERSNLYQIFEQSLMILGDLINQVINQVNESQYAVQILYLISKVIYTANQIQLCPFLMEPGALDPWVHFMKAIIDRQIPFELESQLDDNLQTSELRDKNIHWKLKGIASKFTFRLFSKYGTTKNRAPSDFHQAFCANFVETLVPTLLDSHLQLVFRKKTNFVGSIALSYAIQFLEHASRVPLTMSIMEPYIENILYETTIPVIMVTGLDAFLFIEDPVEFVRRQSDSSETLFSYRQKMISFMYTLCAYKRDKNDYSPVYLHKFLEFCVTNLHQYSAQLQENQGQEMDWRIKEAIMHVIGSLCDLIAFQPDLSNMMEGMMMHHIAPELQSTEPYLRMRATWFYGEFQTLNIRDQGHLNQVIDYIYQCFNDQSNMAVRVMAGKTIYKLLRNNELAQSFLRPALKDILQGYLKMMNEIDCEELVTALEKIVSYYKEDMEPYALMLCRQLSESYIRLL